MPERGNVRPSVVRPFVFSFPDDNLSKYQWIFTKLGLCIGIVEIGFEIVNGRISSIFTYLPKTDPYFHFWMTTLVNINGFSPNLVYVLILWRYALGLLNGTFRQFLIELSARDTTVFSFLDDNFTKYQWIFTKLGVCIDIVDICFGTAYGSISFIFYRVISRNTSVFYFQDNNLSKSQWIFTKFDMRIGIVEICFVGIAHRQILLIYDRVICSRHDNGGV